MRGILLWSAVLALPACSSDSTGANPPGSNPPPGSISLVLSRVVSGLNFPVGLAVPPGDPRLFVLEQAGVIRIVKEGALLSTPFLDIRGKVASGGERGLLGLAFDPAFSGNGRFFVHYTDLQGDIQISGFHASSNPDVADPAETKLLNVPHSTFVNHNGGQLAFGPDGFLYIGLGDGGGGGDPSGNAQSLGSLLGKILRIDVAAGTSYTSPSDNPFAGQSGARPEIWSYGLRNPWRFSFDRSTGDLYIADVGQNSFEEVDVAPAPGRGRGLNFGWNRMEGAHCYPPGSSCSQTGLTLPVLDYPTDVDGTCAVIGGYVYRGSAIGGLAGTYFYSDYCAGWVRSFRYQGGQAIDRFEWASLKLNDNVTTFGQDTDGELYILTQGGTLYRIAAGS